MLEERKKELEEVKKQIKILQARRKWLCNYIVVTEYRKKQKKTKEIVI